MDIILDIDRFFSLFEKSERLTFASGRIDFAGRCNSPHILSFITRHCEFDKAFKRLEYLADYNSYLGHAAAFEKAWGFDTPLPPPEQKRLMPLPHVLYASVRCRKCPACLKLRAWIWEMRAKREYVISQRTWFCTYTLRPSARHVMSVLAGTHVQDFRPVCAEVMKQFTLYMKRLRKQTKAALRYCLVAEKHADGFPHLHCLIHESAGSAPITRRDITDQWHLGFTTAKIAQDHSYGYLAKYLAKEQLARVRASLRYGVT